MLSGAGVGPVANTRTEKDWPNQQTRKPNGRGGWLSMTKNKWIISLFSFLSARLPGNPVDTPLYRAKDEGNAF